MVDYIILFFSAPLLHGLRACNFQDFISPTLELWEGHKRGLEGASQQLSEAKEEALPTLSHATA